MHWCTHYCQSTYCTRSSSLIALFCNPARPSRQRQSLCHYRVTGPYGGQSHPPEMDANAMADCQIVGRIPFRESFCCCSCLLHGCGCYSAPAGRPTSCACWVLASGRPFHQFSTSRIFSVYFFWHSKGGDLARSCQQHDLTTCKLLFSTCLPVSTAACSATNVQADTVFSCIWGHVRLS